MFGYVTAVKNRLTDEQWRRYSAFYCGLCRELGKRGIKARATLTYDMTMLEMLLGGVLGGEETAGLMRCPAAPVKKREFVSNSFVSYAADMNVLLASYKLLDDWKDDGNLLSAAGFRLLSRAAAEAAERYPEQSATVKRELEAISALEAAGENNPDIPAACFGRLMEGLFSVGNNCALISFGHSLGRLVYIMDACVDFEGDLRHKKYNPMTAYKKADFELLLSTLAYDCAEKYRALGCQRDNEIMENILYCGVWSRYYKKYGSESKEGDAYGSKPI